MELYISLDDEAEMEPERELEREPEREVWVKRVQLKRTRGWRTPEDAVSVARPHKWGNPFKVGVDGDDAKCVRLFEEWLLAHPEAVVDARRELRGHDLACWCKPGAPCHADVLLRVANGRGWNQAKDREEGVVRVGSILSGGEPEVHRGIVAEIFSLDEDMLGPGLPDWTSIVLPDGNEMFGPSVRKDGRIYYGNKYEARWEIHEETATPEEFARAREALAVFREAMEEAEKENSAWDDRKRIENMACFNRANVELPLLFPHLARVEDDEDQFFATRENVRRDLEKNFPGVKFRLRERRKLEIRWWGGPSIEIVQEVLGFTLI